MPRVRILPDDVTVDARAGRRLLDISLGAGLPHTHACGGRARCTTCRVLVVDGVDALGDRTRKEERVAGRLGLPDELRLACQASVTGDVTVRRLVLDPEDVALCDFRDRAAPAGVEKEVTVLFSDIRDFTPLAGSLLPYDVIHLLNRHYYEMGRIISAHGGLITAFMGDGLMALFGADHDEPGTPASAVSAGVAMLRRLDERRADLERLYGRVYEINVGVHTGEAVVGLLGGEVSVMTAIGDVVNVASRIESANKEVASRMLVSDETRARLGTDPDAVAATFGRTVELELKGKTGMHTLHEVLV